MSLEMINLHCGGTEAEHFSPLRLGIKNSARLYLSSPSVDLSPTDPSRISWTWIYTAVHDTAYLGSPLNCPINLHLQFHRASVCNKF